MQSVSTQYARLAGKQPQAPIYIVTFAGIPTRYATGPVTSPLGATKNYLRIPTGAGQQITVDEGRSSISSINFSILDKDGEITQLVFQYPMPNRQATVKMGFAGMAEESYANVFVGQVLTYTLDKDNTFYIFQTTDLQRLAKQNIFDAATALTGNATSGDTTLNVGNTAAFPAATGTTGYLRIENEVISYTGKTGTTFTGCTRAQLGTTAAAHTSGTAVKNLIFLLGNPLTLALQILTSTGAGTNGAYDVLPACSGLGIPQAQVNVARFERERDRWTLSMVFQFEESDATEAKKFIEEQIYTLIPAYPVTDNNGLLSVKVAAPPLPTDQAAQQALTDDNMTDRPTFMGNALDHYFFNELDLSFNFNFITGAFASFSIYADATSQAAYGQVAPRSMDSRGMRTANMSQANIDAFGSRFLKRYATPSPLLEAKAFLNTRQIEVGDVLPLTSAKLPNLATGKIGVVAQLVEVISAAPQYDQGKVVFQLLNTPYSYGRRYAGISPSTQPPTNFPVYTAATPAQRNFGFISKKINATRGVMSNGDDGYYVTPG